MSIFLKKIATLIGLFYCLSPAYASRWPTFVPPSREFLLASQLINRDSCPIGQGKISSGILIQIKSICTTFCPQNWFFIVKSDNKCHDLSDFSFQRHEIIYAKDNSSLVQGSQVNAIYNSFELIFRTPREYWYCFEANKDLHTIICGNDT